MKPILNDQTKNKSKGDKKTNRYKGKEIFITNYQLANHVGILCESQVKAGF